MADKNFFSLAWDGIGEFFNEARENIKNKIDTSKDIFEQSMESFKENRILEGIGQSGLGVLSVTGVPFISRDTIKEWADALSGKDNALAQALNATDSGEEMSESALTNASIPLEETVGYRLRQNYVNLVDDGILETEHQLSRNLLGDHIHGRPYEGKYGTEVLADLRAGLSPDDLSMVKDGGDKALTELIGSEEEYNIIIARASYEALGEIGHNDFCTLDASNSLEDNTKIFSENAFDNFRENLAEQIAQYATNSGMDEKSVARQVALWDAYVSDVGMQAFAIADKDDVTLEAYINERVDMITSQKSVEKLSSMIEAFSTVTETEDKAVSTKSIADAVTKSDAAIDRQAMTDELVQGIKTEPEASDELTVD